jgi:hypothetical protein
VAAAGYSPAALRLRPKRVFTRKIQILPEENRPEHGNIGEIRDRQRVEAGCGLADIGGAEIVGDADAEDGQRQSRHHLVPLKPETDDAVNRGRAGTGQPCGSKGQIGIAGHFGDQKSGQRPDDHDPFDAKIEDAGAFGEDLPQRAIEDRGARLDRGRQQGDEDVNIHAAGYGKRFDRR